MYYVNVTAGFCARRLVSSVGTQARQGCRCAAIVFKRNLSRISVPMIWSIYAEPSLAASTAGKSSFPSTSIVPVAGRLTTKPQKNRGLLAIVSLHVFPISVLAKNCCLFVRTIVFLFHRICTAYPQLSHTTSGVCKSTARTGAAAS